MKEETAQLEQQLKLVLEAYKLLEAYVCDLVDNPHENETINEANSLIYKANL